MLLFVVAERRLWASLVVEQNSTVITDPCRPLGNSTLMPYQSMFGHVCTKEYVTDFPTNTTFTMRGCSNSSQCHIEVRRLLTLSHNISAFDQISIREPTDQREFMVKIMTNIFIPIYIYKNLFKYLNNILISFS